MELPTIIIKEHNINYINYIEFETTQEYIKFLSLLNSSSGVTPGKFILNNQILVDIKNNVCAVHIKKTIKEGIFILNNILNDVTYDRIEALFTKRICTSILSDKNLLLKTIEDFGVCVYGIIIYVPNNIIIVTYANTAYKHLDYFNTSKEDIQSLKDSLDLLNQTSLENINIPKL